jgi:hypothetical protein
MSSLVSTGMSNVMKLGVPPTVSVRLSLHPSSPGCDSDDNPLLYSSEELSFLPSWRSRGVRNIECSQSFVNDETSVDGCSVRRRKRFTLS